MIAPFLNTEGQDSKKAGVGGHEQKKNGNRILHGELDMLVLILQLLYMVLEKDVLISNLLERV